MNFTNDDRIITTTKNNKTNENRQQVYVPMIHSGRTVHNARLKQKKIVDNKPNTRKKKEILLYNNNHGPINFISFIAEKKILLFALWFSSNQNRINILLDIVFSSRVLLRAFVAEKQKKSLRSKRPTVNAHRPDDYPPMTPNESVNDFRDERSFISLLFNNFQSFIRYVCT